MPKLNSPAELEELSKDILSKRDSAKPCIAICAGTGCHSLGNQDIINAFKEEIKKQSLKVKVDIRETGCPGFCEKGPVVVIYPEEICYLEVTPEDAPEIVSQTVVNKKVIDRLLYADPDSGEKAVHEYEIPFYQNQMRLLISNNIKIDPRSIDDYLAVGGYSSLAKVLLDMSPEQVITEIKESGLRGRSGGGFPAGRKWEACLIAQADTKYVICNCHEGDPGAFVDRRMMEANPHSILEGMIIGAYAIKANQGYIFVGDEFPLTVENTGIAIRQAEEYGLLGKNILGSGFDLTIRINIDGGGYVCGESTALMASLEGRVGEPVTKYDHATERGLWAKPTVLNNLQTWANVPLIINQGAAKYSSIGTESSKGTRVFSLSGNVKNSGLVEVPMGITLREIIFDIGGGIRDDKKFKGVQVGGPLGGFVPENQLDLRVDFDELSKAGLSMGPSLIVLDENTCIVDMVKYFFTFLYNESCGKCTPCREGLRQTLRIVTNISEGKGKEDDIELLEAISEVQKEASLCALGQGASGPLLSMIKNFRDELDAHIKEKRCPALVCKELSTITSK
ncbi:MAG: NADH-ubiquinone oxidoreductase-F iron-sulfur binding region domain-containing protein [Dehalococcoidales bacterium]